MTRKQILFADNTPDFLITRAEYLEKAGYQVSRAFTLEETRHYLTEAHIHLAILDIRMVNDDDENDVSGLTLAKNPAYRSIPKIILTGKPSVAKVKEALGPMPEGLPPAIDFVDKADGPEVMIQAVDKAFSEFVKINWNLDVRWDTRKPLSFPHLVSILDPQLTNDILIYRASELEDLIRKLFFNYQYIRLGDLLWRDHQQFCLPVLMQSPEMTADLRILVCGDRQLLKKQQEHIEKLAPNALQGTELHSKAETMHFGANLYELRGADTGAVQTLHDLFQMGRERALKTVFGHLLVDVLKAWHQHGHKVEEAYDLMSIYRQWSGLTEGDISPAEVKRRVESLIQSMRTLEGVQIERNDDHITFRFPEGTLGTYPDPVAVVYSILPQYEAPVIYRISPGNLTADNVLVDAKLQAWLTDFGRADQAPQWWDFICLEAAVRFDMSHAPDFSAWQEFEECLVKPARLDEGLEQSEVIPELRTSLALIEQIRQQASSETGSDSIPYYAGLLAWIVKAIVHYDPGVLFTQDRLRGAHLLLAACRVAEQLGTVTDPSLPGGMLRVNENGRIRLGERKVTTLTGLRLKLLQYLIAQNGQIASNQMITENVYGEKYTAAAEDQNQRIRQEISRLREEIEPNPNRPRYIITERGKGYRLNMSGELEE